MPWADFPTDPLYLLIDELNDYWSWIILCELLYNSTWDHYLTAIGSTSRLIYFHDILVCGFKCHSASKYGKEVDNFVLVLVAYI